MKISVNNKVVASVKSIQNDLTDLNDKQVLIVTLACLEECKKRGLTHEK